MAKLNDTACTLLGFLHDRPMTGWDLSEVVQLTVGNFWNVTRSQIYRELKTLEQEGFVTGGERGPRDKRAYTITESGRAAFAEWISREPGPEIARFPLLISVWFGDHLSEDEMDWFLRLHRARHEKRLEFYRQIHSEVEDHSTPSARALRFGLFYEEAVMRWLDSLPNFGGKEETRGSEPPRPAQPRRPGDFRAARTGIRDTAQSDKGGKTKRAGKKSAGGRKGR